MTSMLKSTTAALQEHVQDAKNELTIAELEQKVVKEVKEVKELFYAALKEVKDFPQLLVIATLEKEVAAAKAAYTAADEADADNTMSLFQTYQTAAFGCCYRRKKAAVVAAATVSDVTPEGETKEEVVVDLCPEGALRVKAGLNSLSEAVKKAKEEDIDCLFLESGVYTIEIYKDENGNDCDYVVIDFALKVVGQDKDEVKIRAGLMIKGKKEEDVSFSNCTVTGAKETGVYGNEGAAMHLKNVCIEKCGAFGVYVHVTKRNTMTDCNVNNNKVSGVQVMGGSMVIDGSATTIHHNVTGGDSNCYGLQAWHSSSSIHLKSLTKESISTNNGGAGNYDGDIENNLNY